MVNLLERNLEFRQQRLAMKCISSQDQALAFGHLARFPQNCVDARLVVFKPRGQPILDSFKVQIAGDEKKVFHVIWLGTESQNRFGNDSFVLMGLRHTKACPENRFFAGAIEDGHLRPISCLFLARLPELPCRS